MFSKADPQKLLSYLHKSEYADVLIFLIISSQNLQSRVNLVDKNIKELEEKIKKITKKVEENPNAIVPNDTEISSTFRDIHYTELEVIQRLNMLIELLAVYYHMIRTDVRRMPKSIGRKDFSFKELYQEFDYFNNQKLTDVWTNFKYPNVKYFSELTPQEQSVLKQLLKESAQKILEGFKEIFQFQRKFRSIYNKYKHALSELTGLFGIDEKRNQIETHIYMRDKANDKFCTYIIPVGCDEVHYFIEIATRVYKLLHVLIDNMLLYIVNQEKDFIPRALFIEKKDERMFRGIMKKARSFIVPNFTSKVGIKPPEPKEINKVNQKLREDHICRINKDILDLGTLLKVGITVSKT